MIVNLWYVSGTADTSTNSDDTDTEQPARDSGECWVGLGVFVVTIRFRPAMRALHERLRHLRGTQTVMPFQRRHSTIPSKGPFYKLDAGFELTLT
jgi:hypothetical protein